DQTRKVQEWLSRSMSAVGPAKVTALTRPSEQWTGTGTSAEIGAMLKESGCRAALVGMYRHIADRTRISIRFVDASSSDAFRSWTAEISNAKDIEQVLGQN